MSAKGYKRIKEKDLATYTIKGNTVVYSRDLFDRDTGDVEKTAVVFFEDTVELDAEKAMLEDWLDDVNEQIIDVLKELKKITP